MARQGKLHALALVDEGHALTAAAEAAALAALAKAGATRAGQAALAEAKAKVRFDWLQFLCTFVHRRILIGGGK